MEKAPTGFILKKRLEEFIFYAFACRVNELSHLTVLIMFETIKCPNGSRRLMPFVPSLFLVGKYALEDFQYFFVCPIRSFT